MWGYPSQFIFPLSLIHRASFPNFASPLHRSFSFAWLEGALKLVKFAGVFRFRQSLLVLTIQPQLSASSN